MNKKLKLMAIIMLMLICLISRGVFAAPQSSPNVTPVTGTFKDWTYTGTKRIPYSMNSSTGAMGTTTSLDVHLQRNTEYGAMLILGLSDYGKQANSVKYTTIFEDTSTGLATTTGNVSGIYNISSKKYEHVAAGKADSSYHYYLNNVSSYNRDEYTNSINSSQKKGDVMDIFVSGTATSSNWLRTVKDGQQTNAYYGIERKGFSWRVYQTVNGADALYNRNDSGRISSSSYARAVVTQYN